MKWICGFANAQGGRVFIGIDDKGNVVGLDNAKKMMKDLPNKVTTHLGIVVDVNLHEAPKGEYLEIVVEPQPNPVNYKGEYHFRSGATKQELKGAALDKFLLKKYGRKTLNSVSKRTATNDLSELVDIYKLINNTGFGAGSFYELNNRAIIGQ